MGKPTVVDAVTPFTEEKGKQEVKKLTVLEEDSPKSIYYLLFSETEKGGLN